MPQFDVSSFSSQLFWLVVIFTILYFTISKLIAPKAEKILTARHLYIEDDLQHANEYKKTAKALDIVRQEKKIEINLRVEDMQKQALKILDLHIIEQQKKMELLVKQKKDIALLEINKYIEEFHATEKESYVKLAAFIIEKITNKSANLKFLNQLDEVKKS